MTVYEVFYSIGVTNNTIIFNNANSVTIYPKFLFTLGKRHRISEEKLTRLFNNSLIYKQVDVINGAKQYLVSIYILANSQHSAHIKSKNLFVDMVKEFIKDSDKKYDLAFLDYDDYVYVNTESFNKR